MIKINSTPNFQTGLQTLFMHSPIGICVIDADSCVVESVNTNFLKIVGTSESEIIGRSYWQIFHKNTDKCLVDTVVISGIESEGTDLEITINRSNDLQKIIISFHYQPLKDDQGRVKKVAIWMSETTAKIFAHNQLSERERTLRNVILQAPVAMCIFRGPDLVIEIANKKMFEFWGRDMEKVINKPLFEALPEAKNQGYEELLTKVLKTGIPFSANELPVVLPRDGKATKVFINFTYEPLREPDGSISGIVALATDVTQQVEARLKIKQSEIELQDRINERTKQLAMANSELKQSNSYLADFAYAASHDLQEPIRKIQFFNNKLKTRFSDKLNDDERYLFQRIEYSADRMISLINGLLIYSQVDKGQLKKESVDLNEELKKLVEDLELEIEKTNAAVVIDKLPQIKGYKLGLQQLFRNLLTNALKYHRADINASVNISSSVINGKEKGMELDQLYHEIIVRDNGIGFEQKHADEIFNMFQRLHGKNEYEGSGIGLAIARKVAENHNGKLMAESEPGIGSSFKFYIPISND